MAQLADLPAWRALQDHERELATQHLRDWFANDSDRFDRFSLRLEDLLFDYSNRITEKTINLLLELAPTWWMSISAAPHSRIIFR